MSRGAFDSLNLGRGLGDETEAVEENHARLAAALGYPAGSLFEVSQVHGTRMREVRPGESPAEVRSEEADGLWSDHPGVAVGVRTADCVPILLASPKTGAVAAVHAGWRGVVARILPMAIERLVMSGAIARDLLVAVGPHIRQESFEIGEDVAAEIAAAAPAVRVVERRGGRLVADLGVALREQALLSGVEPAHFDDLGHCTYAEVGSFFSYRRDGARTGRHLAVIRSPGPARS